MEPFNIRKYLSPELLHLLDIVGAEKFMDILSTFGGRTIYVPKNSFKHYRNYLINYEYMHEECTADDLAKKWDLSVSGVRYILRCGIRGKY